MDDKKRIPAISIESQEIIRRLEKCVIADIVGYDELSQLAMGNVQDDKRFALSTARDHLIREKGMVFEPIVNVGMKRLSDSEIVKLGEATLAKIHRAAQRGLKKLVCVDYDKLTGKEQTEFNARFSHLGALHHVTKPRQQKRIEAAVQKCQTRLQLEETLKAFDKSETGDTFPPKMTVIAGGKSA